MKHFKALIAIFILSHINAFGQHDNASPYYVESNYQYGFIWQHRPSMQSILGSNINVFQLNIGKETYGQNYWDKLYRYPDWGGGLYSANLGNDEKMGTANAIYGYLNVPLMLRKKFEVRYNISGGVAYLTKGNIAIGTHINLYFDLNINTRLFLTKRLYLVNAFGATHFSNGATKMPNLGLNLFSYRLGIHYQLSETKPKKIVKEIPAILKENSLNIVLNGGWKEIKSQVGEKYSVLTGSIDYLHRIGYKHKVGAGLDVFYDESLHYLMSVDLPSNVSHNEIMRYGIHLATEYRINNIILGIQLGTYLYANYTDDGIIYQRVGIRYLVYKNLFVNVSLKTSKGVADFIEWGLGYQIPW